MNFTIYEQTGFNMAWNEEVPAYHKYTDAEHNLRHNGFAYWGGDPIHGVRFDHPDWVAIVKLNEPGRYEVYVYRRTKRSELSLI